jgi:hypothetical protein
MVHLGLFGDGLLLSEGLLVLFEFCCELVGLHQVVFLCFQYLTGQSYDLLFTGFFLLPQLVY